MSQENMPSETVIFCPNCQKLLRTSPPYQNVICSSCKCLIHFKQNQSMKMLCSCGKRLMIPVKYMGKGGNCPKCGQNIYAPHFSIHFDKPVPKEIPQEKQENAEIIDSLPDPVDMPTSGFPARQEKESSLQEQKGNLGSEAIDFLPDPVDVISAPPVSYNADNFYDIIG